MVHFLKLKKSNCKNCYMCIRHCPVKSIRFSGGQANIIGDECILCGHCFVACPQNAKEIVSSIETVKVMLDSGSKVIASIAPSVIANYDGIDIKSIRQALQMLRFADAEETAIGATIMKEAEVYDGITDAVLTFEELSEWLEAASIALTPGRATEENSRTRFSPTAGGILKTMTCDDPNYTYIAVDGVENCIAALEDLEGGVSEATLSKCPHAPGVTWVVLSWENITVLQSEDICR